ncbi:DEAD/DEAH box helicase [Psychrosphaera ytuae]|uniref:DEAD/DEAH box helicase n=1 Tax=Psychrosphaera ytuae TaxID=2820710 RepID=A0A975D9X5_9GAMM|nr:DEAD/DEAH box helicase [Psychrosphaera ytuae]QTH63305.1 DEAD/DEAH box helicase [Psychrosphaera ytuae]
MDRKIKEATGAYRVNPTEISEVEDLAQFYSSAAIELQTKLVVLLRSFGYQFHDTKSDLHQHSKLGLLFTSVIEGRPAIFIDCSEDEIASDTFEYVDYTSHQNYLMHKHCGLLRFVCFADEQLEQLSVDLLTFLSHIDAELSIEKRLAAGITYDAITSQSRDLEVSVYGAERDNTHTDPTPPEFNFSVFFADVFGEQSFHALKPEANYIDLSGTRRYVDFVLTTKERDIAVELNGERYHHPRFISEKQYRSQLFKQNSLVADGTLVFRWSDRGMRDSVKLKEQFLLYFGNPEDFQRAPNFKIERQVNFEHYPHQTDAVNKIKEGRARGDNTFLVVLPTGTGKTEVFIEDLAQQLSVNPALSVLAILPTVNLRDQLIQRLEAAFSGLVLTTQFDSNAQVTVVTSAYAIRNFKTQRTTDFEYILVDEAHRAGAIGLKRLLEYFQPQTLLGLTATPDRTDQQKLEQIFGEYEVDLTLEQAIKDGLIPPIRAFRLESNIDFSKVRFLGKDFVKSDLNKTVITPSRDQLITDVLNEYFGQELNGRLMQGVIFCVDVKHTKRMAKMLNNNGLSAVAVDGKNREGIELYTQGKVRFICACDLLNEGWDAPQTSIVVMARPTMSKVLYTQQLGRGTRNHKDKEALYVIDVVDSYGANLGQPWSVHGLFGLNQYQPFGNLVEPKTSRQTELLILDGLFEKERRIEPINIFNFEKEFGHLLNEEQLARELFVSTGTLRQWLKKDDLKPSKTLEFGKKILNYFEPHIVEEVRQQKKLKLRTKETRRDDFFEFLEERDYTRSYKIVFLLSLLNHCNERGEIAIDLLVDKYREYYLRLLDKQERVESKSSQYNDREFLNSPKEVQKSMLQFPFEKFERKCFVYQSDELSIVGFDETLWQKLTNDDLEKARKQMEQDAEDYFGKVTR